VAFIEKRGQHRWRARYRGPDGRERSRTFAKRADAERWIATSSADLIRGEWTDPKLGRMTFAEWVRRWEKTIVEVRPTTRALNLYIATRYLLPRFGTWPLSRITTSDVKTMLAEEMAEGRLSASAVRRQVLVLSVILKAAVQDGRIARNPCAGVKLAQESARPMRFLTAEQLVGIADVAGPHYRPMILTAGLIGLRFGELAGLRVEKVNLLGRSVRVDEQVLEVNGKLSVGPPKTRAGIRTVTIPAALADVLAEHFGTAAVQRSGLAFPSPTGVLLRRSNFRRVWRRACTAAGFDDGPLDGLVFHELRDTAVALAVREGAHPLAIKERLGHASIRTTMDVYGGLFPSLDEAIAQGLDGTFREALAASSRPVTASVAHLRRSGRSDH
jgi:integrase